MRQSTLAMLLLAIALAGCTTDTRVVGGIVPRPLAVTAVSVDERAAAALISGHRAGRGLPPVAIDQRLTRIAAEHARRMASANRLAHVLPGEGSFRRRLAAGGFEASIAAENIGAGYRSLAEAFAGWQRSPDHNANMLRAGVSRIGIAVFSAPDSTYKTYWSLILAEPYSPPIGGPQSLR